MLKRNILYTISSKAQRVPKVMHPDRFVFGDAGDVHVHQVDSKPGEVTHRCTEKERQYYSFTVCHLEWIVSMTSRSNQSIDVMTSPR